MKAEVIISHGSATINLTPEFEFEKQLIESIYKDQLVVVDTHAEYPTTSMYTDTRKHQLQLRLGQKERDPVAGC